MLDLKLPRKSGVEVLEWLRSRPEFDGIPGVMMTSLQEENDRARAYALGAGSCQVKSPDLKELRQVVAGLAEYVELIAKRPFDLKPAGVKSRGGLT